MSDQQKQTQRYFDSVADEWRRKAEGNVDAAVNVVAQRNECAMRVREKLGAGVRRALDAGCGTGELTLDLAAAGVKATGLDFAPEMIARCIAKRDAMDAPNASFETGSVFEYDPPAGTSFDLVTAMGLIEYISPVELRVFMSRVRSWLSPGGAFVVGSRNRLFNVVSLSDYTRMEMGMGTTDALLSEALALAGSPDAASALDAAAAATPNPLPQPPEHPQTGIAVTVRYQYTPGELINLLRGAGLTVATLFPVHYHALPVPAARTRPALHVNVANAIWSLASEDPRLVPYASTFVLDARKI